MRSPNDRGKAFLGRGLVATVLLAGLAACGTTGQGASAELRVGPVDAPQVRGPAADYPIVVGDPYTIAGTEHVPSDTMNYDHVGYLAVEEGAAGYSGAHHTLPLPSYVEVTSLETGRTILVRLERRGPMASNHLLALSPAALAQLDAHAETPVRVRRVNPPEDQRALLRAGEPAPLRMDTPASLLVVLQRRLPANGGASLQPYGTAAADHDGIETVRLGSSAASEAHALPPLDPNLRVRTTEVEPESSETFAGAFSRVEEAVPVRATPEASASEDPTGIYVVQAAAFSTLDRAQRVADEIGGVVTQYRQFYRVRTGPFATRGEAEASLANVRRAGYSDARILTNG